MRQQREESDRNAENQRRAGGAYSTAEPDEVDTEEEVRTSRLLTGGRVLQSPMGAAIAARKTPGQHRALR